MSGAAGRLLKGVPGSELVARLGKGPGREEVFGKGRNLPLSGDVVE